MQILTLNKDYFNTIQIPSFQRPLNMNIVNDLIRHIQERRNIYKEPIFGVLDIVEIPGVFGSTLYIIDGNHRFFSLKQAYQKYGYDIPFYAIIYKCENELEAKEIFNIRNMNVQVPEYIINENSRTILYKEIQVFLSSIDGFNNKTKRPDINLSQFMDKLIESNWIKNINTIGEFNRSITVENERLKNLLSDDNFVKRNRISLPMINKWKSWGNFIGVDQNFTWLY